MIFMHPGDVAADLEYTGAGTGMQCGPQVQMLPLLIAGIQAACSCVGLSDQHTAVAIVEHQTVVLTTVGQLHPALETSLEALVAATFSGY